MKDLRFMTVSDMLEEKIKNSKDEETRHLFKTLKTIAEIHNANSISCSFDYYVDGSYDVVFQFCDCRR